jgi:hypothetical protein
MLRAAYGFGVAYLAYCGWALAQATPGAPPVIVQTLPAHLSTGLPPPPADTAAGWFVATRPRCNAVEVELALRSNPPPASSREEGQSYAAGCYALAGKMDRARQIIEALPAGWRPRAAGIVFEIVHPVADAGDDRSAGPMMRLVLEYWPDNFQALYHAGMSEYAVEDRALAREHLQKFLTLYTADDGWSRNAREVLGRPGMR